MELTCIDHSGIEPLYYQIQQQLLEGIRSGELKAGDHLPSEQEIAARLRVSRMTARLAIKSLCDLGIVYSKQGKGSFVSGLKLEKNFRQVLSFTEEMVQSGRRPESRTLDFGVILAEGEVAQALGLHPHEKVNRLRRLRIADAVPMGIETSYIPERLCPGLKAVFDRRGSLYEILAKRYGIQMAIADEEVEAGLAKTADARLLRIAKGSPVFIFTRTSYVQQGQAAEFVRSTYRADRYKIVNRLVRLKRRFAIHDGKRGG